MQERRNSIANVLELRLSCTNPAIFADTDCNHWVIPHIRPYVLLQVLCVAALYMREDGQYEAATKGGYNQYQTMYGIWKQLYQEGKITKVISVSFLRYWY